MKRFQRGATRPGVLDILTALVLLSILIWASWKQFPAYNRKFQPSVASPTPPFRSPGKF
jgi:hypothetical protein